MSDHPVFHQSGARPWYDESHNIEASLKGYVEFAALVAARREVFKKAQEISGQTFPQVMSEWYLLDGTVWLDYQGNACPSSGSDALPEEFLKRLSNRKIVSKEEFFDQLAFWKQDHESDPEKYPYVSVNYALGKRLPPVSIPCACCNRAWKIEDIADMRVQSEVVEFRPKKSEIGKPLSELWKRFEGRTDAMFIPMEARYAVRNIRLIDHSPNPDFPSLEINARGYYPLKDGESKDHVLRVGDQAEFHKLEFVHGDCQRRRKNRYWKNELKRAFVQAGYQKVSFTTKPSGYHSGYPDWYDVATEIGVVEIGPRKRVVHIGVQNVPNAARPDVLFEKEDVTKTERCVHAWDKDKVVEYLRTILSSALSPRPKNETETTAVA
ncbi:MAG: hypothetical protein WA194_05015 [Patescibacteria group bacterium]